MIERTVEFIKNMDNLIPEDRKAHMTSSNAEKVSDFIELRNSDKKGNFPHCSWFFGVLLCHEM